MEGAEPFPRQQWGVGKRGEQREEMNLTKEVLLAARREFLHSQCYPIPAGPLLKGIN